MELLKEINHKENLNKNGRIIKREAVRGIVLDDEKVLMILSNLNDYKFPGGGVENGETYEETLLREIKEECGALVSRIEECIGKVIEYNKPIEKEYDVFQMTSFYYICNVEENHCRTNLDKYEKKLGFKPVWINIMDAIQNNKSIINSSSTETPRWTRRDTFVLKFVYKMNRNKN